MNTATSHDWIDSSYLLHPPSTATVYRIRNISGKILYIGMTAQFPEVRFSLRGPVPWRDQAASVETIQVPVSEARSVESQEIHRYHPFFNKNCPVCGRINEASVTYQIWRRIHWQYPTRIYTAWYDLAVFTDYIENILGERPKGKAFRLINPDGNWEPGNVCWGSRGRGSYKA